jgi:hypothetical protein
MRCGTRAVVPATAACVASLALLARCGGSTGTPAAPYATSTLEYDAGAPAEASPPPPPNVTLAGRVTRGGSDASATPAIVVLEVGGLDQADPTGLGDGGDVVPTLDVDPFIRYAVLTNSAGDFLARVPEGAVGLHVFDANDLEARVLAQASAAHDGSAPLTRVSLMPLDTEGGAVRRPTAKTPTFSSAEGPKFLTYVAAAQAVAFAVLVAAGSAADPLSSDVLLVDPLIGFARALAPPTAALPGGPYPDGIYSLLLAAPAKPGVYTYSVLVASMHGVTSEPASVVLTVTTTGGPPLPDAGHDAAHVKDGAAG